MKQCKNCGSYDLWDDHGFSTEIECKRCFSIFLKSQLKAIEERKNNESKEH